MTVLSLAVLCLVAALPGPERSMRRAHRLLLTLGLAVITSTSHAFANDSVTIGMVLEPGGARSDQRAGRGDRRSHAL